MLMNIDPDQLTALKEVVIRLITNTTRVTIPDRLKEKRAVRLTELKMYLTQSPYARSLDGASRQTFVNAIVDAAIGGGVLVPMTMVEIITELGQVPNKDGSYLRVADEHLEWLGYRPEDVVYRHADAPPLPPVAWPPEGWKIHPDSTAYFYKDQTVLTEPALRALVAAGRA